MTNNQVRYQEHLERQRSNRKNEQLTAARDQAVRLHYQSADAETQRSNLARELETNRHNLADEQLRQYQAQMGVSQRQQEIELGNSRLAADIEHNTEVRNETARSHLANESEAQRSARARESQLAADLNQRYAAMTAQSADRALPGLGTIVGAITSFAHMGSPQNERYQRSSKNLVQRVRYVGG